MLYISPQLNRYFIADTALVSQFWQLWHDDIFDEVSVNIAHVCVRCIEIKECQLLNRQLVEDLEVRSVLRINNFFLTVLLVSILRPTYVHRVVLVVFVLRHLVLSDSSANEAHAYTKCSTRC